MSSAMMERINLLMTQGRTKEAKSLLETHLSDHPNDFGARYAYAVVLFRNGDNDESRELTEQLLTEDPEDTEILDLSINIDIEDDQLEKAESKAKLLIELNPEDTDAHVTMARVKTNQRSYDRALVAANKALELDAENIEALNLKIMIDGLLGNSSTSDSIQDALNLDAENPSTIANHGIQLLREGKVDEALERLGYALSLNPNNMLAQHGMQEALKSRFWPYRMFFKYKEAVAKLSAGGSWKFLIGTYIGFRIIRSVAKNNEGLEPFLMPIVYIITALFLLTWVIDPLMNIYLLTNKYGKVLLDKNEKTMAQYCAIALIIALLSLGIFFGLGIESMIFLAAISAGMMIPLGTYLQPTKDSNRKLTLFYTIGLGVVGLLGGAFNISVCILIFVVGLFIYQWVINGILIKENARVFE